MSSKLEYLKRYEEKNSTVKKKKRIKKHTNLTIMDDDVATWEDVQGSKESNIDDPEDAPVVAEVQDDSIIKWQPLSVGDDEKNDTRTSPSKELKRNKEDDLSPPRKKDDLSPPRRTKAKGSKRKQDYGIDSDLGAQRSTKKRRPASRGIAGTSTSTIENKDNEVEKKKKDVLALKSDGVNAKTGDQVFMEWGRG